MVWPFFAIGFAFAISQLTLIALGAIGVAIAVYLNFLNKVAEMVAELPTGSGDPIGDILEDY